jgi:hypothetical protein
MTDEELRQYSNQWIEATLHDGHTFVGRLIVDEGFAIEQPSANVDEEPPLVMIDDPATVESVRAVPMPPDTLD